MITLDGKIIAEGRNSIWRPEVSLSRHAEMEAMRVVPPEMWEQAEGMTLYTTLEPCLMCMGAILLHGIGRVLYGSSDPAAGGITAAESLPVFFAGQYSKSIYLGPVLPEKCDELNERISRLELLEEVFKS